MEKTEDPKIEIVVYGAQPSTDPPPPEIHPDFIDCLQIRNFTLLKNKKDSPPEESSVPTPS